MKAKARPKGVAQESQKPWPRISESVLIIFFWHSPWRTLNHNYRFNQLRDRSILSGQQPSAFQSLLYAINDMTKSQGSHVAENHIYDDDQRSGRFQEELKSLRTQEVVRKME